MRNPPNRYKTAKPGYWRNPEPGYPKTIYWKVVAGNRRLTILEEYDLLFSENDEKYLKSL